MDAIVERADGQWRAFEIKLGPDRVDEAVESLQNFIAKIDTGKCGQPAVMGVITGRGMGYVREDGMAVVPIGALGP